MANDGGTPPRIDGDASETASPRPTRRDHSHADAQSTPPKGDGCDVAERLRNAQPDGGDDHRDATDGDVDAGDRASGSLAEAVPVDKDTAHSDEAPPREVPEAAVEHHGAVADEERTSVADCADDADGGGTDVGDDSGEAPSESLLVEMQELAEEVASVRSALRGPTTESAEELLWPIRSWSHRTARADRREEDDSAAIAPAVRLIPMTAPTGQASASDPASDGQAAPLLRVVSFEDGVYRGHVKLEAALPAPSEESGEKPDDTPIEHFVPHGWGIATSHTGLRRVGQWRDGEQVGVGSLQSAVFLYDGEWHASAGPSGYGIGTFALGATFIGCWHSGKPYGLGRLQTFEDGQCEHGWFYGTRCLQAVETGNEEQLHEACVERHLPAQRFEEQPQRGLFLVGQILEDSRFSSLRSAMTQWRRVACDHAIALARRRRAATMATWVEAHATEGDAIAWHLSNEMQAYQTRMATVLKEVAAGRQNHTRVQRIREFHTNKLNTAILQRDLAHRCVASQEESIALMEQELGEVSTLLDEATQAQAECQRLAEQQQLVKRQIENAAVKINALRQQIRHREAADDQQQQHHQVQQELSRKNIKTPATPSYAKAIHGPRHVKTSNPNADVDGELPFVCDVPGCTCGIPRHVFTRVAAALNGE